MAKRWIWIISAAILLLGACEREYGEREEISPETGETVTVSLQMTLGSGMETDFDILPMLESQAVKDSVLTRIYNEYRALVIKKIDGRWIIDQVVTAYLDADPKHDELLWDVKRNTSFLPLKLELRPGFYRIVVFFNYQAGKWNDELKTGTIVEDENNPDAPIPPAWTYFVGGKGFENKDCFALNKELFTGQAEFSVEKTDDLHSAPYPSEWKIKMVRRVCCLRGVLKESPPGEVPFITTMHVFYTTLVADPGNKIPEGLDIWGKAWYNQSNPLTRTKLCWSTDGWVVAGNGINYMFSLPNAHIFVPFYIVGEEGLSCSFTELVVTGQSDNFSYRGKEGSAIHRELQPGFIDGFVLKTLKQQPDPVGKPKEYYVEEINEKPSDLFGPYREWN